MADNHFKVNRGLSLAPQTSAPSNPANGDVYYDSVLNKFRKYENGAWTDFGSSGGSGGTGINLVGLDTSFLATNTSDSGAETTVGNWAAYSDAAAATPVDMTGGSATVTIARTATVGEALDGSGSFKVVKDAANRQGQGVSLVVNIPEGYKGQRVSFSGIFKTISGSFADGDIVMSVYDVTNSVLLSVTNPNLPTNSAYFVSHFTLGATTAQIRVGFHFATTAATAVTFSFDDVAVIPKRTVFDPTSPLFTTGDILYYSTQNTRLPIGAYGQLIMPRAGVPAYVRPPGQINYLANNPDAEIDTTGYATYSDAAGTSPVDGTGGSPNITFTRTTSSPLRENASFLFTKDAANRQGQGASYDFTIDSCDQAKPLAIAFDYAIASGAFADGDLTVYLYDVTNAQVIQPGPFRVTSATTGLGQKFVSYFQTNVNSTSYRLIFHVASTSASAYTVKLDNLSVGPTYQPYGTVITDWQSYTPGTTQGFGTPTSQEIFYRRVGDSVEIQGRCITGTNTGTEGRIGLPPGLTSSTSKITTIRQAGTWTRGAATVMDGVTLIESGVTYLTFGRQTSTEAGLTKRNGDNITGSGEAFSFWASVPIQGWSSNVQLSTDADTRVCAFRGVEAASATSITTSVTTVGVNSAVINTHGAFASNTFTCPVPGIYQVTGLVYWAATATSQTYEAYILKNASISFIGEFFKSDTTSAEVVVNGTILLDCAAGDTIKLAARVSSVAKSTINTGTGSFFEVRRLSGPAQIAASETIACSYQTNASSAAVSSGTPDTLSFTTKILDTHNSFSGSTYTVPASGIYEIMACIQMTTSSATAAPSAQIAVNGASVAAVFQNGASTAGRNCCPMVQYLGRLTQGQTITILGRDGVGLSTYVAGSNGTYIYIKRVGT